VRVVTWNLEGVLRLTGKVLKLEEKLLFCVTSFILTEALTLMEGKARFGRRASLFCTSRQRGNKSRHANYTLYESALATIILPHGVCSTVFGRDRGISTARSIVYHSTIRRIRYAYQTSAYRVFGQRWATTPWLLQPLWLPIQPCDLRRAFMLVLTLPICSKRLYSQTQT
jgi:hypothetical protein